MSAAMAQARFLGLLRSLPEEEIRADGGSEDGNDGEEKVAIERYRWNEGRDEHLAPRDLNAECGDDVDQQHQRQELQEAGVAVIGDENLCKQAGEPESESIEKRGAANDEPQPFAHRSEIRSYVDRVGDHQQNDKSNNRPARQSISDVSRQPLPRFPADARADDLDRRHEGQREQHRPSERKAELGSCLRIGGDTAGVIVCRAGRVGGHGKRANLTLVDERQQRWRRAEIHLDAAAEHVGDGVRAAPCTECWRCRSW